MAACVAGSPSPEKFVTPLPANVVIAPAESTRRMRRLFWSEM